MHTHTQTHTHTVDVVVDLASVVQQSELLSAHHLPGLSIGQLVTTRITQTLSDKVLGHNIATHYAMENQNKLFLLNTFR
jgi:hypothetical protein